MMMYVAQCTVCSGGLGVAGRRCWLDDGVTKFDLKGEWKEGWVVDAS